VNRSARALNYKYTVDGRTANDAPFVEYRAAYGRRIGMCVSSPY